MKDRSDGVTLLAAILLLLCTAYAVWKPVAAGYELSIYRAYSPLFWTSILLGMALAVGATVDRARRVPTAGLPLPFFVLVGFWLLVYALPELRGYAWYGRHDPMTHVGFLLDILRTGKIGEGNFYPLFHLVAAEINLLGGAPPATAAAILPAWLAALFIFGSSAFCLRLFPNSLAGPGAAVLSTIPFFGWNQLEFAPKILGFYLLPVLLLFAFRYYETGHSLFAYALIPTLLVLPIIHPGEIAPFTVLTLCVMVLALTAFDALPKPAFRRTLRLGIFPAVATIAWFSSFAVFQRDIQRVANNFFGASTEAYSRESVLQAASAKAESAGLSIFDVLEFGLRRFGTDILLFVVAAIAGIYFLRERKRTPHPVGLALGVTFLIGSALFPITLMIDFIIADLGEWRQLKYLVMIAIPLAGFALAAIAQWHRLRRPAVAVCAAAALWSLIAVPALFNVYPSPLTATYNQAITGPEFAGSNWWLEHKTPGVLTDAAFFLQVRFAHFHNGVDPTTHGNDIRGYATSVFPPPHFGYNDSASVVDYYRLETSVSSARNSERYIVWNNLTEQFYNDLFPSKARYTPEDIAQLREDPVVSVIYDNHEITVFYVDARSEAQRRTR